MKIIILAQFSYENQLTVEDVELGVMESGFEVSHVLSVEHDVGVYWAEQENIPYTIYPILWDDLKGCENPKVNKWGKKYNPQAGIIRNQNIVQNADGMILFWSEEDKQSEYIIKEMKKNNKRVHVAKVSPEFIF